MVGASVLGAPHANPRGFLSTDRAVERHATFSPSWERRWAAWPACRGSAALHDPSRRIPVHAWLPGPEYSAGSARGSRRSRPSGCSAGPPPPDSSICECPLRWRTGSFRAALHIGIPQRPRALQYRDQFGRARRHGRLGDYGFWSFLFRLRVDARAILSCVVYVWYRARHTWQCRGTPPRTAGGVVCVAYSRHHLAIRRGVLSAVDATAMDAIHFARPTTIVCVRRHAGHCLRQLDFTTWAALGGVSCPAIHFACLLVLYTCVSTCRAYRPHRPLQRRNLKLEGFGRQCLAHHPSNGAPMLGR